MERDNGTFSIYEAPNWKPLLLFKIKIKRNLGKFK